MVGVWRNNNDNNNNNCGVKRDRDRDRDRDRFVVLARVCLAVGRSVYVCLFLSVSYSLRALITRHPRLLHTI